VSYRNLFEGIVNNTAVPIFPLPTVLFPGGHLPLRIFEQRYIDMVRECSANGSYFGVCLVSPPKEPGQRGSHMCTGTLAEITDWSTMDDGLLGITASGRQKFVIQSSRMRDNGLMMAEVLITDEPESIEIPVQYSVLSMVTARFMEQMGSNYPGFQPSHLQDAAWVGYRLTELLPLDAKEKQILLQLGDPLERLQLLLEAMPRFQQDG
jgi:Lon protease-like protein